MWKEITGYELKALLYAEKYGVIEYCVEGNRMIYYSSYPMEHMTYKSAVDLDSMEETRVALKNYYKAYTSKIGGKVQANYCI